MWFKMPCKKNRTSSLITLVVVWMISALPVVVFSDQLTARKPDQALFWAIHKDDGIVGYVLGTIHSEDPRVLDFSEDLLLKLKSNDVFAMEMVPDLPTLSRLTEYMRYPPEKNLESVIGTQRFSILKDALADYRMPADFLNTMKPWAVMLTLSTPPPETGFFMDLSLSLRASGNGLKVIGMETLEQQLSFLQDMPLSMQLALLDQAIAEYQEVGTTHDQMVNAYLKNNLIELQEITETQLESVGKEVREYFIESGINERNSRMLGTLLAELEHNTVFIAVGALHLPGESGLLDLLRGHGYQLQALSMPFAEE